MYLRSFESRNRSRVFIDSFTACHVYSTGVPCSVRRRRVLRVCSSRRTIKTVLRVGRPRRRRRRPEQAWPVRFALRGRSVRCVPVRGCPVRCVPVRGLPVRGFAVRSLAVRRHVLRHFPARLFAVRRLAVRGLVVRRSSSPVRRGLVVRHIPRRQDFRLTVRVLPVSTLCVVTRNLQRKHGPAPHSISYHVIA